MEISRRFFLGGAITLVAAQVFIPSVSMMANIPTIYGDGIEDDSGGLAALFRNEPVTFNKEQIGVESHEGIVFHTGRFAISRTVIVPDEVNLEIERAIFISKGLDINDAFFWSNYKHPALADNIGLIFEAPKDYKARFVHHVYPVDKETYSKMTQDQIQQNEYDDYLPPVKHNV